MLIKMTYEQVTNMSFMQAMGKLTNAPMNIKVSYHIKKIAEEINQVRKTIMAEYEEKVLKPHAKKNEDGSLVQPPVVEEAQKEAFLKAQDEFGKTEFELKREQLLLSQLAEVKLSAGDLSVLEPVYTEMGLVPNQLTGGQSA